ncbi:(2E,6E)-farnesyl diphosphate synthase [Endozoicomonas sp. SM1973]|uniref:(2E,6E)-farnesyl diphosphate synthase n=2 Tax=Spartinivicinus marinus TaxID=2994442 RepID=A0A853ID61_9GAMM|nr:farnesyl diphosphate synthase [Spartinivicinus marinus]MCX4025971.1 (2E,6E)-farnesyl diphosphate synthase [Spartinivicinus marinus]NYZ67871.1 (2E,6E)-farnesyl diphosphate synthase [Spartinivicinus marinus]
MSQQKQLVELQQRANHLLDNLVSSRPNTAPYLKKAINYSLTQGGKRLRPLLTYATCAGLNGSLENADPAAMAIECIHTYSLIHDDLPAMDDDALRRGQPTCHIAFDEATAILAGDALQALAFEALSTNDWYPDCVLPPSTKLKQIQILAQASGMNGMVAGQSIDLSSVGKQLSLEQLENMHHCKTGALIKASIQLGALASNQVEESAWQQLGRFADAVGLAFQIQDDILDIESDTETLGKTQGADIANDKPTYPAIMGLSQAKQKAQQLTDEALAILAPLGQAAAPLKQLALLIIQRNH